MPETVAVPTGGRSRRMGAPEARLVASHGTPQAVAGALR
jgi:hypothetical protein